MSSFFKGLALFVAITCGVWVAVLWRWEATSHDMSTPDIVVYLVLLPLTVFVLALLMRWAWRGAVARQSAAAASAAQAAPATPTAAATHTEDARRHATVQLLASALVCAAGASAAELLEAAKAGKPRPALDSELRDDNGLPLFTARIADLDVDGMRAAIEPHLVACRGQQPEWSALDLPDHVVRALAALQTPLADALAALLPWQALFAPAADAPRGTPPERRVRVLVGWPADWSPFAQEVARKVVAAAWADEGFAALPSACFVLTSVAGSGEELLLQADRLLQTLAREGRDEPLLVAACHSSVGAEAVEALERAQLLFSASSRPKGRMPGEAAAALLLASASWPADPDADAPPPHLHRPSVVLRDKPIDAPGRVGHDAALAAITQALATGRLEAAAVTAVATDADQHTPRSAEMHAGTLGLLPHLDAAEDLRLLATVTGAVGAVSPLLVLACAAETAQANDAPCLAATFGDALARLSVVALPGPPKPATPAPADAQAGAKA